VAIAPRLEKVQRLRARHRDLAADQRAVVTVKLKKATVIKLRKRLRRHAFVRLSVSVRATDAAGNPRTVRRSGKVRR
jgi:hypothetical protein